MSQFLPGVIYDLDPKTAAHLVLMGAEVVPGVTSALAVSSPEESLLTHEQLTGGVNVTQSIRGEHDPLRRRE